MTGYPSESRVPHHSGDPAGAASRALTKTVSGVSGDGVQDQTSWLAGTDDAGIRPSAARTDTSTNRFTSYVYPARFHSNHVPDVHAGSGAHRSNSRPQDRLDGKAPDLRVSQAFQSCGYQRVSKVARSFNPAGLQQLHVVARDNEV